MKSIITKKRIYFNLKIVERVIKPNGYTRVILSYSPDHKDVIQLKFVVEKERDSYMLTTRTYTEQPTHYFNCMFLQVEKFIEASGVLEGKYLLMNVDEDTYVLLPPNCVKNVHDIDFIQYAKTRAVTHVEETYFRVLPSGRFVLSADFADLVINKRVQLSNKELLIRDGMGAKVSSMNKHLGRKRNMLMGRVPKKVEITPGKYLLAKKSPVDYVVSKVES